MLTYQKDPQEISATTG